VNIVNYEDAMDARIYDRAGEYYVLDRIRVGREGEMMFHISLGRYFGKVEIMYIEY